MSSLLVLLLMLASTMILQTRCATEPAEGWPAIDVESPFRVYAVDDDDEGGCGVPLQKATAMRDAGFTKVACPFGAVLIGATDSYPDEYILFGANVLANILDQDADGIVDDPSVVEELHYKTTGRRGAMLACGTSRKEERNEEKLGRVFDYTFSCQTWHAWAYDDYSGPLEQERIFKGVMMEEAFHMVHQNGYARVYPDQLGMEDYTSSVVGRETARLQCADPGWLHPENWCPAGPPRDPGDPPLLSVEGTCNYPSCDVAEFYKMVLFLLLGMGEENDPEGPEVWLSDRMPGRREDVAALVTDEFLAVIADPGLHQLRAPLTGDYSVSVVSSLPAPPATGSDDGMGEDNYVDDYATEVPTSEFLFGSRIVCPGMSQDKYCDCSLDCVNNPRWCACEEGKACCGDFSSDGFDSKYSQHSRAIAVAFGAIVYIYNSL